ncbi:hypothetical protein IAQ61_000509 [Plenodomus lingam]|uniref:Zn(2)-C6 fungal-type domain-containing protein n=1 Tax=Leptosphaeria maculans (strain JN3 / isolate v23.1.3 / race Av1-4-5-6-7-8) TaxID=985895 RepID=E5A6Z4_LEPMJ|nr:hypothetical protein LEMA_P086280.1 [Plenodomus lingam JN3]KAH9880220.1 hypothetical protein IAQ61_000509 [Plenodomus lingam]CBX99389.1 hypothetical protein LEMA_P086280.1 [Plenodomus lingam JN3]
MSSASEYNDAESTLDSSSDVEQELPSRPSSRRPRRQSRTPLTPQKRRRLESVDPSRIRNYYFEGKYNDAYRLLYNEHVHRAAARLEPLDTARYYSMQIGASTWSASELSVFFAALERLGKADAPGIAKAVGAKTIPEIQELLLLLHDAAIKQGGTKVTLRDVPAAIELGEDCNRRLDTLAEALAWYQEMHEASQEQSKFGQYWLITSDIAGHIESALESNRSRAASSVPPSGAETTRRGGKVIPGACISCKLHKQKCDRGTPCSNCVRRKLDECVYPKLRAQPGLPDTENGKGQPDTIQDPDAVISAIPEAQLLRADMMLTLSRTLFMNRSPTIPSPWPHWSEIASDFATEPAIYRSAFNDLHTLVVSVTKRLMQTAITQATSRLRSQRRRTKKGMVPLVKRRDVFSALEIVGMKRNGDERWRGVARRCALRVVRGRPERVGGRSAKGEISWDEVERIMAPESPRFAEPGATDTEGSEGPSTSFKRRAMRSGTPLPMERLALYDSQSESDDEDFDAGSDVSMLDDHAPTFARQSTQPRDIHGRYASVAPTAGEGQPERKYKSLEQFDQDVSRREERALRLTLNIQALSEDEQEIGTGAVEEDSIGCTEEVVTDADGWRLWTEYRAEWEEFEDPVPRAHFAANRNPAPATSHIAMVLSTQPEVVSDDYSHGNRSSSDDGIARRRPKPVQSIELRTQNPRAYAALQERAAMMTDTLESEEGFDENNSSDIELEAEHPSHSIEVVEDTRRARDRDESMDWDTYMDV